MCPCCCCGLLEMEPESSQSQMPRLTTRALSISDERLHRDEIDNLVRNFRHKNHNPIFSVLQHSLTVGAWRCL